MRDDHGHDRGHEDAVSQVAQQVVQHEESLWLDAAVDTGKKIILRSLAEHRRLPHKSPGAGRPGVEITRTLQTL